MAWTRSEQMARVKNAKTKPEMMLRKALWSRGLRYRLKVKTPAGKPDLVFPRARLAVFIDGCFWHGCPDHYSRPKTRSDFWAEKLEANVRRDGDIRKKLQDAGWQVLRIWEHEVFQNLEAAIDKIEQTLAGHYRQTQQWRVISVVPAPNQEGHEIRNLCLLGENIILKNAKGPRVTGTRKSQGPRVKSQAL